MSKLAASDAYASLVDVLISLRRKMGVSQVELAARLGKTQQFVSYIERRERRVDVIEFYAIARALGVPPKEAFAKLAHKLPEHVEI